MSTVSTATDFAAGFFFLGDNPDMVSNQFLECTLEKVFSTHRAVCHGSSPSQDSRRGSSMTAKNDLLSQLDNLHITEHGSERIRKNLALGTVDVMSWCKNRIRNADGEVTRIGKNWYAESGEYVITINANSKAIITAHKKFVPYYLR